MNKDLIAHLIFGLFCAAAGAGVVWVLTLIAGYPLLRVILGEMVIITLGILLFIWACERIGSFRWRNGL